MLGCLFRLGLGKLSVGRRGSEGGGGEYVLQAHLLRLLGAIYVSSCTSARWDTFLLTTTIGRSLVLVTRGRGQESKFAY